MTLMFCDVVGSTAIADTRDPEEIGDFLRDYHRMCAQVVERFGGFIDDVQGDGMLVRFGYPEIREDDARRAVLCGLEIVRAVRDRTPPLGIEPAIDLRVRIAVHTDLVVLAGGRIAGAAPNEASRIQNLARPDSVVISDATHALVRPWFDVESMGHVELRGVSRPVELFTVLGERASGLPEPGATPSAFVGRQAELQLITELWRAAGDRRGIGPLALFVTGGPGIGKTRLVVEAAHALDARCIECRCSSYHQTTSLHAFRKVLEDACQIVEEDGPSQRLAKLRGRLDQREGQGADLPFLAAALQIPSSAVSAPPEVDPSALRQMALLAAARLVQAYVGDGPSMLFVDDLQWADQSTLDLISAVLAAPLPGMLLVLAARDGFEPPWAGPVLQRLPLAPLGVPELERMAGLMPEGARLSTEQRAELISRSDGVPLFLEELVRTADALRQGRDLHRSIRYADYSIPAALRDPLLARLASPGVDLDLAQMAAAIGRDVDRELLQQIAGLDDQAFQARLDTLVQAGLVDPSGENAIRFRHELIREVAYETQRRSTRRERHSRIADRLLQAGVGSSQGDTGQSAFHLERAQRYQEAVVVNVQAARRDQDVGAHTEATRRLTETLQLVDHLAEDVHRQQSELMVRELRSFSAVMSGGYAAPEAAEDYSRCVELCELLGLGPELLPSLILSWSYYTSRGHLVDADRVSDKVERALGNAGLSFPIADVGRGIVEFFRGRFRTARRLMEAFVDQPWAKSEGQPPAGWPLPNDPLAAVCAHLVPTLWISGERGAAGEMADYALDRAAGLAFPYGPFSIGYVKSLLAMTRRLEGDHDGAAQLARETIEVGERHGFTLWRLVGAIQLGISGVHAGDHSMLDQLVADVLTWRHLLVADVWTPYWLTELAAAQRAAGRTEEALASLDEALAVAASTGSDFYSVETLRIRGEVRRERGEGGVADLRNAVERASYQGALTLEARAAMSLGGAMAE